MAVRVEYVGFTNTAGSREYRLRVQEGENPSRDFVVAIPNEAFAAHQARFQDAPDICYQKILKALESTAEPEEHMALSVADLQDYRQSHAVKHRGHRPAERPVPRTVNVAPAFTQKGWRP